MGSGSEMVSLTSKDKYLPASILPALAGGWGGANNSQQHEVIGVLTCRQNLGRD